VLVEYKLQNLHIAALIRDGTHTRLFYRATVAQTLALYRQSVVADVSPSLADPLRCHKHQIQ